MRINADEIAEAVIVKRYRLQKENGLFDSSRLTVFMGHHVLIAIRNDRKWFDSLSEVRDPGKGKEITFMGLKVVILHNPEQLIVAYEG